MRILFDTNVLIAAFISHGTCAELLEHCIRRYTLISSEFILKEFQHSLISKLRFSHVEAVRAAQLLRLSSIIVTPISLEKGECPDPNDLFILGSAFAGQCQCLITGDKKLLNLKQYKGIEILSPRDFWKYEALKGRD